jgi:hypothetical protein
MNILTLAYVFRSVSFFRKIRNYLSKLGAQRTILSYYRVAGQRTLFIDDVEFIAIGME